MKELYITGTIELNDLYNIRQFKEELAGVDVVKISSPGGSLFDGLAIHDAIKEAGVDTEIIGTTASAGTLISMAGKNRRITKNSRYLVHQAHGAFEGNAEKAKQQYDQLIELDAQIVAIYEAGTSLSRDEIVALMKEEKYISAEEAFEHGFVTEIIEPKNLTLNFLTMDTFKNDAGEQVNALQKEVENLRNELKNKEHDEEKKNEKDKEIEDLKAEIKDLKAKLAEKDDKEVENAVENAIESGVLKAEQKDELVLKAKAMGIDNFSFMVSKIEKPLNTASFKNKIKPGKVQVGEDKDPFLNLSNEDKKSLADRFKNVAKNGGMAQWRNKNPEEYQMAVKSYSELK